MSGKAFIFYGDTDLLGAFSKDLQKNGAEQKNKDQNRLACDRTQLPVHVGYQHLSLQHYGHVDCHNQSPGQKGI